MKKRVRRCPENSEEASVFTYMFECTYGTCQCPPGARSLGRRRHKNKQAVKMMISTALRRSAALRRVLTAATTSSGTRTYHVSVALSADALDMADSFSRRHREF